MSKEFPVNLSTASLLPWSNWMSTEWSADTAKKAGFDGLEILPGYSVVRELRANGRLEAPSQSVQTIHDSWVRDGRAEVEQGFRPSMHRSITAQAMADFLRSPMLFPREETTIKTIHGLEEVYRGIPVVFHWKEDENLFRTPRLEVHPLINMSPGELVKWVEEKPRERSLVLDISQRKFWKYLDSQGVAKEDWKKVFRKLLPYASESHFQIGNQNEYLQVVNKDFDGSLGIVLREMKTQGFRGLIVVEFNPNPKSLLLPSTNRKMFNEVVDFVKRA